MSAMSNHYTSLVDSDSYEKVADDSIVELDAHLGVPIPHGQYSHPEVTVDELETIADQLRSVGSPQLAAQIDIEAKHLEKNADHVFRFTALALADIVVALSIARTKATYNNDFDGVYAITQFGRLVTESSDELMAESLTYKEIPDLRPVNDDRTHIDPFDVISDKQLLEFVDSHGNSLTPDDFVEAEDVDDVV